MVAGYIVGELFVGPGAVKAVLIVHKVFVIVVTV